VKWLESVFFDAHKAQGRFEHTGQHDGSWTESNRLARPHACCAGHTRRRASTQSPCCYSRQFTFTIDLNRDKLMFSGR
jgi:hypothetical protein